MRADDGVEWRPRLFRHVEGGPGGRDEGEEDLDWIINAEVYVSYIVSCHLSGRTPALRSLNI